MLFRSERAKTGMDAIVKIAGYESASFVYNANTLSNQDDPQAIHLITCFRILS